MGIKRRRLPLRITLALLLVLLTAAWNLIRLWSSFALAAALQKYAPRPGPIYIGITGAAAAALSLFIFWSLLNRAVWAPRGLLGGAVIYAVWIWTDRLIFGQQPTSGWPFSLLITGVLLAFIAVVSLDPRNRFYFGKEAHEQQEQDR